MSTVMTTIRKFKKEIIAIAVAISIAYFFQLTFIIFSGTLTVADFLPNIGIQIAIVPIVSWPLMGAFKVSWMKKWLKITAVSVIFAVPFVIISLFGTPFWLEPIFWVINILSSAFICFLVFKRTEKSD